MMLRGIKKWGVSIFLNIQTGLLIKKQILTENLSSGLRAVVIKTGGFRIVS